MQGEPVVYQLVNHGLVDFENVKRIDVAVLGGKHLRLREQGAGRGKRRRLVAVLDRSVATCPEGARARSGATESKQWKWKWRTTEYTEYSESEWIGEEEGLVL